MPTPTAVTNWNKTAITMAKIYPSLFFWIPLLLLFLVGTQTREAYPATQTFPQMPQDGAGKVIK